MFRAGAVTICYSNRLLQYSFSHKFSCYYQPSPSGATEQTVVISPGARTLEEGEKTVVSSASRFLNVFFYFFHSLRSTIQTLTSHALSPLWTHEHKFYPYEYLRRPNCQILEIDKITTNVSLPTRTSSTTESITPLHSKILLPRVEPRTWGATKALVATILFVRN